MITQFPPVGLASGAGLLGYAQVTANQGGITTEVDLTGLAVTVTVPAGRRIRITASANLSSSVANDVYEVRIKEGTTQFKSQSGLLPTTTYGMGFEFSAVISPSAGSHTYKLTALRGQGSGTLLLGASAALPSFILVEDITASQFPDAAPPYLNPPRAQASRSTAQSIPHNAWTPITFTAEDKDTDGMFTTATGDRFAVVSVGRYIATLTAAFVANGTGMRGFAICTGVSAGAGAFASALIPTTGGTFGTTLTISGEVDLTAGSSVSYQVYQNSGAGLNIAPGGTDLIRATLRWVAPL